MVARSSRSSATSPRTPLSCRYSSPNSCPTVLTSIVGHKARPTARLFGPAQARHGPTWVGPMPAQPDRRAVPAFGPRALWPTITHSGCLHSEWPEGNADEATRALPSAGLPAVPQPIELYNIWIRKIECSKGWLDGQDKGPGDGLGGKKEATCGPSVDGIGGDGIWASPSRGAVACCVIEERSGRLGATGEGSALREAINSMAWTGPQRLGVTGDSFPSLAGRSRALHRSRTVHHPSLPSPLLRPPLEPPPS